MTMEVKKSTGGRTNGKKRKRLKNSFTRPKAISKLIVIILAALSVAAAILYLFLGKPTAKEIDEVIDDGTILQGVSINGVDVSGMNYAQAREAALGSVEELLRSMHITVRHGTSMWVLTAADIQPISSLDSAIKEALTLGRGGSVIENNQVRDDIAANGRDIAVSFRPNEKALKARLAEIGAYLDTEPAEPYAEAVTASAEPDFAYYDGADGYMLNEAALYEQIAALLADGQLKAELEPALDFIPSAMTMDGVKAQTKFVSMFQTSFGGSRKARDEKRVGNIQKACTLLNGLRVEAGAEFNFNGYIGPRTEEGGWPLAPGIVNGNQYEDQPGGGICQVSTTMYNALLCAGASMQRGSTLDDILAKDIQGISITERKHHSWPSNYVDTGLDSTVTGTVESGKSLNFVNNTGAPLFLFAYCDQLNYTVTVYIYGLPLEEGVTYQVRGVVDEVIEPGETIINYDKTKPADFSEDTIKARKGYKATAYRDKYVNGVLDPNATEKLYSETYNAVTGERTVGTGGAEPPATPKPQ